LDDCIITNALYRISSNRQCTEGKYRKHMHRVLFGNEINRNFAQHCAN